MPQLCNPSLGSIVLQHTGKCKKKKKMKYWGTYFLPQYHARGPFFFALAHTLIMFVIAGSQLELLMVQ